MKISMSNKTTWLAQLLILLFTTLLSIQPALSKERIRYHINGPDGSVLRTVDDKGIAVAAYRYSPFGEQLQQKKPANLKAQTGFVGGIHEQQDLVYLKQRYYNPTIGRFYQPDPVTFLQGGAGQINRYQYGWNDPFTFKDPSGTNPDYLAMTDPSAYYEMRAIELGNDPYTWEGANATAKTVQKEAFYELLGWGVGWGVGKGFGAIFARFESTSVSKISFINPFDVRFSQSSIKGSFSNGGSINDLAASLNKGIVQPKEIPPIRLVEKDNTLFTLDNRRLETFRRANVNVPYRMATPQEAASEGWKFTTKNGGISIKVRGE